MANVTNPLVVSGLTNGKTYSCVVMSGVYANSVASLQATSSASATAMPNAGPSNAAGVLSAAANTTHITAYPTYASYCNYTNQSATGTGAVPTVTYSTSNTATTTGTMTKAGSMISNATYQPFLVYACVALLYFVLCFPVSLVAQSLERKLHGNRR